MQLITQADRFANLKDFQDKEIISVKLKETSFVFVDDVLEERTGNTLMIRVKDRKTPIQTRLFHRYCPFCGEKLPGTQNKHEVFKPKS